MDLAVPTEFLLLAYFHEVSAIFSKNHVYFSLILKYGTCTSSLLMITFPLQGILSGLVPHVGMEFKNSDEAWAFLA